MKKRVFGIILACVLCLVGCGSVGSKDIKIAFSNVTFADDVNGVVTKCGAATPDNISDNSDGITAYSYDSDYFEGATVRYNFQEDGKIRSISMNYHSSSEEDVTELYNKLVSDISAEYGDPEATEDGSMTMWREQAISITVMPVISNYVLDCVYFNPDIKVAQ